MGECFNSIGWPPVKQGHYWWARDAPAPTGPIETEALVERPSGPKHVAEGTMRFVSRSEPIFTSDAGGTLVFRRESTKSFHNAGCLIGFATPTTVSNR